MNKFSFVILRCMDSVVCAEYSFVFGIVGLVKAAESCLGNGAVITVSNMRRVRKLNDDIWKM